MGDESYQSYRDDRSRVLGVGSNRAHLDSVSARIGTAIVAFCDARRGQSFYMEQLRRHVEEVVGHVAPGSPDRVLRDLRQRGIVSYRVLDRSRSLYEVWP